VGIDEGDDRVVLRVGALQIGTDDRRFADADRAGDDDKPVAFLDAVPEGAQGRFVTGAQEEKLRIRRDMKRRFGQLIKVEVHPCAPRPACGDSRREYDITSPAP
jgi:hypothetical protein